MSPILYYVHDPMCSWCWGFSRSLNQLLNDLPKEVKVQRLLGGLAPDSDSIMPESMQDYIKRSWSRIEDNIEGVKFNFDFWSKCTPRRSTYPACRAVIAARKQGIENDKKMTDAIQKAYYQQARNPSDNSTLIELADEIGLSVSEFEKDLLSDETDKILTDEINFCRDIFAESYPSLVLKTKDNLTLISIDYNNSQKMLEIINENLKVK